MRKLTPISEVARDLFLAWASDNGYTLAEPFEWRGTVGRYKATCPKGHDCAPIPDRVRTGVGGCPACGHNNAHKPGSLNKDGSVKRTDRARLSFLAWASDNGYTLAEPFEWRGVAAKYEAICPGGHPCSPKPNSVQQGQGGCAPCSRIRIDGPKSLAARDRFLAWASDNGYTLAKPFKWSGTLATYTATCPKGHLCNPSPGHVQAGVGGCGGCRGAAWDAFYVVRNPYIDNVKFGITSGDMRPRLRDHKRDGYTEVLRAFSGLPEGEALGLEQELMKVLKCAGVAPVQGREYFPTTTLNVILGFVDGWLS